MTCYCNRYVFECERHCGIGDILEIWGSIINGFSIPLKEEHKLFLIRVLLPLHRAKGMTMYHKQLSYCVSQFVQKEPALGGVAVMAILRYWPITNSQKEVLIIDELEELVQNIAPDQYRKLALPLCTKITRCFNSLNSQVIKSLGRIIIKIFDGSQCPSTGPQGSQHGNESTFSDWYEILI